MELTEEIVKFEKTYDKVVYEIDTFSFLTGAGAKKKIYTLNITFEDKKVGHTLRFKMTEEEWEEFKSEINRA